eukprot:12268-Heterococcus_DN1.PRE.1
MEISMFTFVSYPLLACVCATRQQIDACQTDTSCLACLSSGDAGDADFNVEQGCSVAAYREYLTTRMTAACKADANKSGSTLSGILDCQANTVEAACNTYATLNRCKDEVRLVLGCHAYHHICAHMHKLSRDTHMTVSAFACDASYYDVHGWLRLSAPELCVQPPITTVRCSTATDQQVITAADNCSANAKCDACVSDNDPKFAALNGVCDANKNEDVLRAQFPKDCLTIPQIDKGA